MGLPEWDLATVRATEAVIQEVRRQLEGGNRVLLWASLPCAPWCTWQSVSSRLIVELHDRIEQQRAQSIHM
eukprot:917055-Heterocapsa_arctica.AAC.1